MDWTLLAIGVLASWCLIMLATIAYIRRFAAAAEPEAPTDRDGNAILVEALRSSIAHHPDNWELTTTGLKHGSGAEIGYTNGVVWVAHGGARSVVPEDLARDLIRTIQIRNAKKLLESLRPEGEA